MRQTSNSTMSSDKRISPPFDAVEADMLAAWSEAMRVRGVYTEVNRSHDFLTEALHVLPGSRDDAWWLVHKTPEGAAAVRLWPGIARIVPTLGDALDIVLREIDRGTIGDHSLSDFDRSEP